VQVQAPQCAGGAARRGALVGGQHGLLLQPASGAGAGSGGGGGGGASAAASTSAPAVTDAATSSTTTGGQHGYGAKLTKIFSTSFAVATLDSARGLAYSQEWRDNMGSAGRPAVTPAPPGAADYTAVTFQPDLARFGGALDEAALQFSGAHDAGVPPEQFVKDMRAANKLIMGIGHRVKSVSNPDKRVSIIVAYAKAHFAATDVLNYALEVEKVTTAKRENLILNVDGAIAVCFTDLVRSCGAFTR
jgi:hypothetical protein